jgi:hypothetical protein
LDNLEVNNLEVNNLECPKLTCIIPDQALGILEGYLENRMFNTAGQLGSHKSRISETYLNNDVLESQEFLVQYNKEAK